MPDRDYDVNNIYAWTREDVGRIVRKTLRAHLREREEREERSNERENEIDRDRVNE